MSQQEETVAQAILQTLIADEFAYVEVDGLERVHVRGSVDVLLLAKAAITALRAAD